MSALATTLHHAKYACMQILFHPTKFTPPKKKFSNKSLTHQQASQNSSLHDPTGKQQLGHLSSLCLIRFSYSNAQVMSGNYSDSEDEDYGDLRTTNVTLGYAVTEETSDKISHLGGEPVCFNLPPIHFHRSPQFQFRN